MYVCTVHRVAGDDSVRQSTRGHRSTYHLLSSARAVTGFTLLTTKYSSGTRYASSSAAAVPCSTSNSSQPTPIPYLCKNNADNCPGSESSRFETHLTHSPPQVAADRQPQIATPAMTLPSHTDDTYSRVLAPGSAVSRSRKPECRTTDQGQADSERGCACAPSQIGFSDEVMAHHAPATVLRGRTSQGRRTSVLRRRKIAIQCSPVTASVCSYLQHCLPTNS